MCTHAAGMICIGRVLTGRMPEDETEEDFRCGTCSLSVFQREKVLKKEEEEIVEDWDEKQPDHIPRVDWRDGKGVMGGWECVVNGDCSFLDNGEERSWLVLFFVFFSFPTSCRLSWVTLSCWYAILFFRPGLQQTHRNRTEHIPDLIAGPSPWSIRSPTTRNHQQTQIHQHHPPHNQTTQIQPFSSEKSKPWRPVKRRKRRWTQSMC